MFFFTLNLVWITLDSSNLIYLIYEVVTWELSEEFEIVFVKI